MSSPVQTKSTASITKQKSRKHVKKWPDRDIIDAQVLYLQGADADQIQALIDMPARSVMRFVGQTPDDPRRSVEENTKTSAWHDHCWERALDQVAKIRNKDRQNKGLGPLARENRERRVEPEITGFDHPRNKARNKAKAQAKFKENSKPKVKSAPSSPVRISAPAPAEGGVGPVRTSPTTAGARVSAFGAVVDPAQKLKDQLAQRKKAKAVGAGSPTGSPVSGANGFGTSSVRSTLSTSAGSSSGAFPAGLEAYSPLGLADPVSPSLGKGKLGGPPGVSV